MRKLSGIVAVLALVASGCSSAPKSQGPAGTLSPTPAHSPSVSPSPSAPPPPPPATLIAHGTRHTTKDLDGAALFTIATNKNRVLHWFSRLIEPRIENETTLTVVEEVTNGKKATSTFRRIPITGGSPTTLFSTPVRVSTYAWSPKRTAIAFFGYDETGLGVWVWNRGGKVELKRRIESQAGRGGTDLDDQHLGWSPDGEHLLVVATAAGSPGDGEFKTMFVIAKGKDVVTPRAATNGRWISNTEIVYEDFVAPYAWHVMDVTTGKSRSIGAVANSFRARVSADGKLLVYDRTPQDATIHLYSFADGTDRVIAAKGAAPIWLAGDTIAYTNADICEPGEDCGLLSWKTTGGTKRMVIGLNPTTFGLPTTMDADVF